MKERPSGRRKSGQFMLVATVVISLLNASFGPAAACGPFFPYAVFVNQLHPDFSMKLFAAGNLGCIQSSWARSYLVVSYRYLQGPPLNASEQNAALKLWNKRLEWSGMSEDDNSQFWLRERNAVPGLKKAQAPSTYEYDSTASCYIETIAPDAFRNAAATLKALVAKYGLKSEAVRQWAQAQDKVFASKPGAALIPGPLAGVDPLLKTYRDYQIACAQFYAQAYSEAERLFAKIADDKGSPARELSLYLTARIEAKQALDDTDGKALSKAVAVIEETIKKASGSPYVSDMQELVSVLLYKIDRVNRFEQMVRQLTQGGDAHFGQDLEDITVFLSDLKDEIASEGSGAGAGESQAPADGAGKESKPDTAKTKAAAQALWDKQTAQFDLVDWLSTIKGDCKGNAVKAGSAGNADGCGEHAYARWQEKRSLPWLLAALMCDSSAAHQDELAAAAAKVAPNSPGFESVSWYLIDSLIRKHKHAEAAKRLDLLLARKTIAPSARNMFVAQKAALATTFKQLIQASVLRPAEVTFADGQDLPNNWLSMQNTMAYYPAPATFATETLLDMNDNLPLSKWLEMAGYADLPAELYGRVVRATWMRAQILGQREKADGLEPALKKAYPFLAKYLSEYDTARSAEEKNFALARFVLMTVGMSPYLESGIERHGLKLSEFDDYNDNYWVATNPVKSYKAKPDAKPDDNSESGSQEVLRKNYSSIDRFLTATERAAASRELKKIWQENCPKFLGEPVLAWAATHASDPRLPEALYRLVKLPRWSDRSPAGSKYSRAAYELLHKNYPKNVWTQKAEYWY